MESGLHAQFRELYGQHPLMASAPGRVNLIGEHTDYNSGFVLPGAIDKRVLVAIAENQEEKLNFFASQYQEKISLSLEQIQPMKGWVNYFLGMIHYLIPPGKKFTGLDVIVDGQVPLGAGMSSSAAICSAFGFALNELFGLHQSRMELALAGQQTEHHFVGVQCGIMDQFASLHGRADYVMKLDCRSLSFEYIPFAFPDYSIVLMNTMVSHSLAGSEYNKRRQECEEGVSILQKKFSGIHSLRDVELSQLKSSRLEMSESVFRRCAFVINENKRLLDGCQLLREGHIERFGKLMFEAHEDLSKGYEVSCVESDFLVEEAKGFPGVAGARQMGGGFGGCTINIVQNGAIESFVQKMQFLYEKRFGIKPEAYITRLDEGAKLIG